MAVRQDIVASLQPLIELFEHKRAKLSHKSWLRFVQATKRRVLANPEQFIGPHVAEQKAVVDVIVEEIFHHYISWGTPASEGATNEVLMPLNGLESTELSKDLSPAEKKFPEGEN